MSSICIYCEKPITKISCEHVIQSAFGSTLKSSKLLCADCNNYFSRKDSGNVDSVLVNQFNIFRNLFSIWGDRNTPPPILRNVGTLEGMPIHLGPGGTPIFAKSIREESIDEHGNLVISVSSPDISRAREQYGHIKKQFKDDGVKLCDSKKYRVYCNEFLNFKIDIGGGLALKGVLKNIYSFLFYLIREKEIELPVSMKDLSAVRRYLRYDEKSALVYASIDYKNSVPVKILTNELSNYIFVFGSAKADAIFGYFIVFGHIVFSAVLKEGYTGEDFGYGIKHSPIDKSKIFIDNMKIPEFDTSVTKNYPLHAQGYFPLVKKSYDELLQMYFDQSSKSIVEDIADIALSTHWPDEGSTILPEHNKNVARTIAEEVASFYFKIPKEQDINLDEDAE